MSKAIILTTINQPSKGVQIISEKTKNLNIPFFIIGDNKTPLDFNIEYGSYFDLDRQRKAFPSFSDILPINHYSRKNIGYLLAFKEGCDLIHETDDDNIPLDNFWKDFKTEIIVQNVQLNCGVDWCNIYEFFTKQKIWPRGFPLERINSNEKFKLNLDLVSSNWSIIQGLANENPDVDAIYRFIGVLPVNFSDNLNVYLPPGLWCPFNSQNTIFKRDFYALLYLPSFCSFRMTDIWRSLIAQRCLWELNRGIVFTSPTVSQERNVHNILNDFEQEIDGYLMNNKIAIILGNLKLISNDLCGNLLSCYEALIKEEIFPLAELEIVKAWIKQVNQLL